MEEIWKDIEGWEGFYQVSDQGRVRSLDRVVWSIDGRRRRISSRILKIHYGTDGRGLVALARDGEEHTVAVPRLVAIAFIPNPKNLPTVYHSDGHRDHDQASNLKWGVSEDGAIYTGRPNHPVYCKTCHIQYDSMHACDLGHGWGTNHTFWIFAGHGNSYGHDLISK